MKILVLEDDQNRHSTFNNLRDMGHHVTICEDAVSCKQMLLSNEEFDIFFIDHDLGGQQMVNPLEENTGSDVCRWYISRIHSAAKIKLAVTHTLNPQGAREISFTLHTIDIPCYEIQFMQLRDNMRDYMNVFQQTIDTD